MVDNGKSNGLYRCPGRGWNEHVACFCSTDLLRPPKRKTVLRVRQKTVVHRSTESVMHRSGESVMRFRRMGVQRCTAFSPLKRTAFACVSVDPVVSFGAIGRQKLVSKGAEPHRDSGKSRSRIVGPLAKERPFEGPDVAAQRPEPHRDPESTVFFFADFEIRGLRYRVRGYKLSARSVIHHVPRYWQERLPADYGALFGRSVSGDTRYGA